MIVAFLGFSRIFLLGILILKGLTARRLICRSALGPVLNKLNRTCITLFSLY
jgi:hypothetical protein